MGDETRTQRNRMNVEKENERKTNNYYAVKAKEIRETGTRQKFKSKGKRGNC